MAILHYQVSQTDHSWVVSCEDVPIDAFDGRNNAVDAAMNLVSAAKTRGDQAILHIDRVRTSYEVGAVKS
jgi:hypothetical protein